MRSLELFAGAGGLALGMARAGFRHAAVIEWDRDACNTFRRNQENSSTSVECWPVHQCDVRGFNYDSLGEVMVVSGGPPCQPFSLGGKHRGFQDNRDMFPEAIRAVRELKPRAFIFENVKGLMRESFSSYFEYIHLQLTYPSVLRQQDETWIEHRARLERFHTANKKSSEYNVVFRLLNAADYGVPQRRERVFFVGFRSDLGVEWTFPKATHSEDALLASQWIVGDYWDRHDIPRRRRPTLAGRQAQRVARMARELGFEDETSPWMTVRDAISDLPDPQKIPYNGIANHAFIDGARTYPGHTGSPLDEPAKTLKAGDHGVPGGENMLVRPDGSVRYFTVREAARIQTFPDEFVFQGSWTEAMRQLGNAVPVRLAEVVASSVAKTLRRRQLAK